MQEKIIYKFTMKQLSEFVTKHVADERKIAVVSGLKPTFNHQGELEFSFEAVPIE